MKLIFLGTRGGIKPRSRLHNKHATLLIQYRKQKILIDCGADWTSDVFDLAPQAIFITHAHPDHVAGLQYGSPCPVYATAETFQRIKRYPIEEKIIMYPYKSIHLGLITIQAYPLIHSLRAPAVGYKISANKKILFYVPDLIAIKNTKKALHKLNLYIGDGARITRPLIRISEGTRIGHTSIRNQMEWCKKYHVPRVIITHCGSEIVAGNELVVRDKIKNLSKDFKIPLTVAYDGMQVKL